MARSALCVGINEFEHLPMSSWLSGCVNDAHDIAGALKKLGFTARTTTVLTDADATKAKVMAALGAMVGRTKARNDAPRLRSKRSTALMSPMVATCMRSSMGSPAFRYRSASHRASGRLRQTTWLRSVPQAGSRRSSAAIRYSSSSVSRSSTD